MRTTQEHLLISDISDDIILLKNGGGALVLQVSAVNFGLLSDKEQLAIISAFAQMLNSLSFSLQIVIRSERLNISSYLNLLEKAQQSQTNSLLSGLIVNYKQFIQSTIKENEVLDKEFYLIIPLYSLELGIRASKESLEKKIKTVLLPRRDQMIRQLSRVGLKAAQLSNQQLIELFYDIYNGQFVENIILDGHKTETIDVNLKQPVKVDQKTFTQSPPPATQSQMPIQQAIQSRNHPFVVEELDDKE